MLTFVIQLMGAEMIRTLLLAPMALIMTALPFKDYFPAIYRASASDHGLFPLIVVTTMGLIYSIILFMPILLQNNISKKNYIYFKRLIYAVHIGACLYIFFILMRLLGFF